MTDLEFLQYTVNLAKENVAAGGRPFAALVVKDGQIISRGVNQILISNDPTAHAELTALRAACQFLQNLSLEGCMVYASGQPCPMCLAAMRMVGIHKIVYAYSNQDAAPFGLSTEKIANILRQVPDQQEGLEFIQLKLDSSFAVYPLWQQKNT